MSIRGKRYKCRQWPLHREPLHKRRYRVRSDYLLLLSERPFPKRNRREKDQRCTTRPGSHDDDPRSLSVAQRYRSYNLWPYALKMANDVHMLTPTLKQEGAATPLEKFSEVRPMISSFHPFGCPVYVLDSAIASGKSLPKWEERARVGIYPLCYYYGIYLGPSPRHSRLVAMVLSLTTGLGSTQYHVVFDDNFQTIRNGHPGSLSYKSDWQDLAGLNLNLEEQEQKTSTK
jgi:hypothetical protein